MGGHELLPDPALNLTAVVHYVNIKNGGTPDDTAADPGMFVLPAKYALSKRTSVYAHAAHAKAKAKGGVAVGISRDNSEDGGVPGFGEHQTGLPVGIQHRF